MTNSALMTRIFQVKILAVTALNGSSSSSNSSTSINTKSLARVKSASIDIFGLITIRLTPSSYNYLGRLLLQMTQITIAFIPRSVDTINFNSSLVFQNETLMLVQVIFQSPDEISNFYYDKLVVSDQFGSVYTDVPPQFEKVQEVTNYYAYSLCGLLVLSILCFSIFNNIRWMRLFYRGGSSMLWGMMELIQVLVFAGLINAPNSGQLLIFMTYFFRMVTFNVSWTFLDPYIPIIVNQPLGSEISWSIRQLSL